MALRYRRGPTRIATILFLEMDRHGRRRMKPKTESQTQPSLFKTMCEKCGKREAYWSATWCEPCIWKLVRPRRAKRQPRRKFQPF